jgi:polyhydroxyalkanoate synthase
VVRRCVERGLRVYLLEWLTPTQAEDEFGLADYAFRLPGLALEVVAAETGSAAPILAGHSLGGTFAAIVAALAPERVGGLVLVDAPLAFGEDGGPLAEAVRAMPPIQRLREAAGSPVPGSVINALSMGAAPDAFGGQRLSDFVASLLDLRALAIHARVERWTYDEFPLPGRLFEETLEGLYREDRFRAGTLPVGQRRAMLATLCAPVIAVVNPVGRVVPPASVLKGLEAAKPASVEILTYEGDRGSVLQHLGPLVAPAAHERLWPRILDWAEALAR